jgi:putative transposase
MGAIVPSYKGFHFPVEIISHCVWLYHRFPLSFREVEERMMERGVVVSHETVRQWCAKFGQTYVGTGRLTMIMIDIANANTKCPTACRV